MTNDSRNEGRLVKGVVSLVWLPIQVYCRRSANDGFLPTMPFSDDLHKYRYVLKCKVGWNAFRRHLPKDTLGGYRAAAHPDEFKEGSLTGYTLKFEFDLPNQIVRSTELSTEWWTKSDYYYAQIKANPVLQCMLQYYTVYLPTIVQKSAFSDWLKDQLTAREEDSLPYVGRKRFTLADAYHRHAREAAGEHGTNGPHSSGPLPPDESRDIPFLDLYQTVGGVCFSTHVRHPGD